MYLFSNSISNDNKTLVTTTLFDPFNLQISMQFFDKKLILMYYIEFRENQLNDFKRNLKDFICSQKSILLTSFCFTKFKYNRFKPPLTGYG